MDRMIGEMLEAMQANGLADDTLVVYTSDHVCPCYRCSWLHLDLLYWVTT